jgi:hypothetical protein
MDVWPSLYFGPSKDRQLVTSLLALRQHPSARGPASPLDFYLSWMSPVFPFMFRLIRSPRSGPVNDLHSFGGKIRTAATCKIALNINHINTLIGTNVKPRTPRNHGVASPRNVLIRETERRYQGLTAKDVLQCGQGNAAITRINSLLTRSPHSTHLVLSSRTPSNKFIIKLTPYFGKQAYLFLNSPTSRRNSFNAPPFILISSPRPALASAVAGIPRDSASTMTLTAMLPAVSCAP